MNPNQAAYRSDPTTRVVWQERIGEMKASIKDMKRGPNEKGTKKNAPDIGSDSDISAKIPNPITTQVVIKAGDFAPVLICGERRGLAPRSAGAGDGLGVGVMAWGGHGNWAADRGCHAATCSWKEIPRKHGCIHGRSSPNPPPAQVTKPAPRRIGRTQANKLLLRGFNSTGR